MQQDELHYVCKGRDEIDNENNDAKTSHETKMFTMQFHMSKCREEVGFNRSTEWQ